MPLLLAQSANAYTVEQYSNLLKTRAFITVTSWLRSRTCLTRLICARLDIQDDVVFRTWSSNVSCGSKTTPRSLAEDVRARSFPIRDMEKIMLITKKVKRKKREMWMAKK